MSQACNFNLWAPILSPSLSVTLISLHFLSNIPERTKGHHTSWENIFGFLKDRSKLNNDEDKHTWTIPSLHNRFTKLLINLSVMCVLSNKSRLQLQLYSDVCPWCYCTHLFLSCCSPCQQTSIKLHTYVLPVLYQHKTFTISIRSGVWTHIQVTQATNRERGLWRFLFPKN